MIIKSELEKKIIQIEIDLRSITNKCPASLLSGESGIVLFYSYLYKQFKDEKYLDSVRSHLESVFEHIETNITNTSIDHGIAGVGWLIQHLVTDGILDDSYIETLNEIDELLISSIKRDVALRRYDYFTGLIGKGLYFLERLEFDKSKTHYLLSISNELMSLKENNICAWQDNYAINRKPSENVAFNLGLAHGNPSILYFLTKVWHTSDAKNNELLKTIGDLSNWLRNQEICNSGRCFYPNYIIDENSYPNQFSGFNLGWCYGDLGVLTSLLQYAIAVDDKELKGYCIFRAKEISNNIVEYLPIDSGLCHGLAGVAVIYQRLFHYTNEDSFHQTSEFLFSEMLKSAKFSDGLAGFKSHIGNDEWVSDFSFLTGVSGIGLAMLSMLHENNRKWDRILLLC